MEHSILCNLAWYHLKSYATLVHSLLRRSCCWQMYIYNFCSQPYARFRDRFCIIPTWPCTKFRRNQMIANIFPNYISISIINSCSLFHILVNDYAIVSLNPVIGPLWLKRISIHSIVNLFAIYKFHHNVIIVWKCGAMLWLEFAWCNSIHFVLYGFFLFCFLLIIHWIFSRKVVCCHRMPSLVSVFSLLVYVLMKKNPVMPFTRRLSKLKIFAWLSFPFRLYYFFYQYAVIMIYS